MGGGKMGWRTVSEAVLQKAPSFAARKNFKTTSNARNEAMFREATDFAQNIKILEKDLKALLKHMDVHFKNLRCILVSPLPRIYNEGPSGVIPEEADPKFLSTNMEVEGIPRAAEEARRRMQQEVLNPLREWYNIYRQIADRMKQLETLRLEVDSRRRTVDNLQGKLQRVLANMGGKPNGEDQARETHETILHKQQKLEGTFSRFMEMEELVYNSLCTLVRDTCVLRDYTLSCLTIVQDAFQAAAKAYDTVPMAQQSTNNLSPYSKENKYEVQLPNAGKTTPRGIGGLFERLRGLGSRQPSVSPHAYKDAQEAPDQVNKFANYNYGLYTAPSQRMPNSYMVPQGQPMRTTQDTDIPYIPSVPSGQLGGGPGYVQAHPPYNQNGSGSPYQQQGAGGYQLQQQASIKYQAAVGYGAQAGRQPSLQPQPSAEYGAARYGGVLPTSTAPNSIAVGATGWTQEGY